MDAAWPPAEPPKFFGRVSDQRVLDWAWVERQLIEAGTYWVVARPSGHPHPRPVWGVWSAPSIFLSIGSPVLARDVAIDPRIAVHLDSGTDVVVVEGVATVVTEPSARLLEAYDAKYEWHYTYEEYGPLTRVDPLTVVAWRSAGWAGQEGFQAVGRWRFG